MAQPLEAPPAAGHVRTAGTMWVLFLGVGMVMIGNGLQGTLLGVRSELEGFGTVTIGIVMASYYVGFLLGSTAAPRFLGGVGHIRVFTALASIASTAVLIHALIVEPVTWAAMRFLTGLSMAGIYVVAESWLNARATNATRGRLLSVYLIVVMGGLGAGQLLISVADPAGFTLFIVASVLVSLAVVPMALAPVAAPSLPEQVRARFGEVYRLAPVGIVAGFATGMANGAFFGIGAVYAVRAGMSLTRVALFMGAAIVGSVLLQAPVGSASDRFSRRRVLFVVTFAAALVALTSTGVQPGSATMMGLIALYGGMSFPMYSVALAHYNDIIPDELRVPAASTFVFMVGVGAIFGPLAAAAALAVVGTNGFFWSLVGIHSALALFVAYWLGVRWSIPVDKTAKALAVPARGLVTMALTMSRKRSK